MSINSIDRANVDASLHNLIFAAHIERLFYPAPNGAGPKEAAVAAEFAAMADKISQGDSNIDAEAQMIRSAANPPQLFKDVCAAHGADPDKVTEVFYKAAFVADAVFTEEESNLLRRMAHPTFLDLPPNLYEWRMISGIVQVLGIKSAAGRFELSRLASRDLPFVLQSLPMTPQRMIVDGIDFQRGGQARVLKQLRHSFLAMTSPEAPVEEPTTPLNINDAIDAYKLPEGSPFSETEAELSKARWGILYVKHLLTDRSAVQKLQQIKGKFHALLPTTALVIYDRLQAGRVADPARFNPQIVFDNIRAAQDTVDPILEAWIVKTVEAGTGEKKFALTCAAALPHDYCARNKPSPLIEKIMTRLEGFSPHPLTTAQLAEMIGADAATLRNFLTARKPQGQAYAWDEGERRYKVREGSVFENLVVMLGVHPEDLLDFPPAPQEKPRLPATQSTTPTVPSCSWEAAEMVEAKKLFGKNFETPDALIKTVLAYVNAGPQRGQAEEAVREALQNPRAVTDKHGFPSLGHLWVMWALEPSTRDMNPELMLIALTTTFDDAQEVLTDKWREKTLEAFYRQPERPNGEKKPQTAPEKPVLTPQASLAFLAIRMAFERREGAESAGRATSYSGFLRWAGYAEEREHIAAHKWGEMLDFVGLLYDGLPKQFTREQRQKYTENMALLNNILRLGYPDFVPEKAFAALLGTSAKGKQAAHSAEKLLQAAPG